MTNGELKQRIIQLQKELSGLRAAQEENERIASLDIADPAIRQSAKDNLPKIKEQIDLTMEKMVQAENTLHHRTF